MMRKARTAILLPVILVTALSATSCQQGSDSSSDFGPKMGIGAALGAAGGGLLGAAAGGGATGIAAGVLLGGLVGGATGSYLDDQDKRTAAAATQQALNDKPSGTTTTWKNPDSGNSGSVTPIRTYQTADRPVLPRVRADGDDRRQAAEELRHRLPPAGRLLATPGLTRLRRRADGRQRKEESMRRSRWMIVWSSSRRCSGQGKPTPEAAAQDASANYHVTDRDDNAAIDRQEYQQRMIDVFYFADKNKDGVVTIEELAVIETVDPVAFKKADKNGDGKLTVIEFVDVPDARLRRGRRQQGRRT